MTSGIRGNSDPLFAVRSRQDRMIERLDVMQTSLNTLMVTFNENFGVIRRLLGDPQEGDAGGDQTAPKAKEVLRLPPLPKCARAAKTPDRAMELGSESRDEGVRSSEQNFGLLKPSNECDAVVTEQSPVVQAEVVHVIEVKNRSTLYDKEMRARLADRDVRNIHVRNVAIDVLLRSGRVDDALQMLDEMRELDNGHAFNENSTGIVFGASLNKNWSEICSELDVILYNSCEAAIIEKFTDMEKHEVGDIIVKSLSESIYNIKLLVTRGSGFKRLKNF